MNENDNLPDDFEKEFKVKKELNPVISPIAAAFFGLIAIFFLYQVGGSLITMLIFGLDLENADINALRLMTVAGQILLILLPTLILTRYVYEDVTSVLRVKLPTLPEVGIFILGLIILTPILQDLIFIQNFLFDRLAESSEIMQKLKSLLDELDKIIESTYSSMLSANNIFEGILVIIVIAITPAICEESFFRGFVQKSFEQKQKPLLAVFITSFFFAIYHFNPFGLVALLLLGMYLGYSAYMSNSILIPIILHFLNNFFAVIAYFIYGNEEINDLDVIEKMSITEHLISLFVLLLVFGLFIRFVQKYYQKIKNLEVNHDLS